MKTASLLQRFLNMNSEEILQSIESQYSLNLDGMITPYKSYINQVVGVQSEDGTRLIAKFYRPNRWSREAILDEHHFIFDCAKHEVPVVAPLYNSKKESLSHVEGLYFALFPFKAGRLFEINKDEDWVRLGQVIGRIHRIGMGAIAHQRITYTPMKTTSLYIRDLLSDQIIPSDYQSSFSAICEKALNVMTPLFKNIELHRIHGDLHQANILERGKEGLMLVDFDDMMIGPAVQDLWLLLPSHYPDSYIEMELLLEGYRQFNPFNNRELQLIEPLRFMRLIYFLSWCAMQREEATFKMLFPKWGSDEFWYTEIGDLKSQVERMSESLES